MAHETDKTNPSSATVEDVALERALEGLFRLSTNRRLDNRQTAAVGASVTRAGYSLLRSLADHGKLSLRELADASYMDAATASRQINQLMNDGLVDRQTASDARAIELSLTDLGHVIYQRIVTYRLAHLTNVLSTWTLDDRGHLAELVNRLAVNLSETALPSPATAPTSRR